MIRCKVPDGVGGQQPIRSKNAGQNDPNQVRTPSSSIQFQRMNINLPFCA